MYDRETESRAAVEEGLLASREHIFYPFSIASLDIGAFYMPISCKSKTIFGVHLNLLRISISVIFPQHTEYSAFKMDLR